ncbi:hypothetical protein C0583_07100 [Candidatus Parcubacteria bacterium]|nr:MAG: hypothetical protein C0583_07100 [Candidatus Parcubacteria bacterium]
MLNKEKRKRAIALLIALPRTELLNASNLKEVEKIVDELMSQVSDDFFDILELMIYHPDEYLHHCETVGMDEDFQTVLVKNLEKMNRARKMEKVLSN